MDILEKSIKDICNNYYKYLLKLQNVHGVGYGFKYINNLNTFKPCLNVLVKKKISKNYIATNNLIPKNYMGIMTDVIEIEPPKLNSGLPVISKKFRPLQSGANIGTYERNGTLGCIVTKPYYYFFREYFILSNSHVLSDLNKNPIGSPIFQPGVGIDKDDSNNIIGHLTNFIPLKFTTMDNINDPPVNYVDCAIAKISNNNLISNKIYKLGEIKGIGKIFLNQKIKKMGSHSGFKKGSVEMMHVSTFIPVTETKELFFKEIILNKLKAKNGDSGSIILNDSNEVLGLHFSSNDDQTYMCDINLVLSKLNVSLYTG